MKETTKIAAKAQPEEEKDSVWRSNAKKTATIVLAILACVTLFITIFFTCIQSVAFNENRYTTEQTQLGLAEKAGISQDDMKSIMHQLLRYCRGARNNLDLTATINGQTRYVFDDREKDHMVDVQKLFVGGFKLRTILIIAFLFLLLLLVYTARTKTLRELARGWVITVSVLGALLLAIGIYFAVDFDAAWTQFHLIFFSNDLWQLYENDMLIELLMPLFDGIVQAIMVASAVCLAVVTAGAIVVLRMTRTKKPKAIKNAT